MEAIEASVLMMVIAYPLLFVVMAAFMTLTYLLVKIFPAD